jgi:RNA polymerase sigma factor (sigma-70 family)
VCSALDDSEDLIRSATAGDPAAMRVLIARLSPVIAARVRRVYARRFRQIFGAEERDDLIQEVWLTLFDRNAKALRSYDRSHGLTLEAFVGLLAERQVMKLSIKQHAQRRGGGRVLIALDRVEPTAPLSACPERSVAAVELEQQLCAHLLQTLPERGRLIWRYFVQAGSSAEAVADLLGVKVQDL